MNFILPDLTYNYDALEPNIDKQTMEIHHTKHHQAYINNSNDTLKNLPKLTNLSADELIKNLNKIQSDYRITIRNNLGGHINHSIFWKGLKIGTCLHGVLKNAIEYNFDNVENFKNIFEKTSMAHFGSGWVWLIKKDNKLIIASTSNQDNPLMGESIAGVSGYPIIGLDVWEHAYYLKYQNRRLDYVKSFWNVVNWDEATVRFKQT